MIHMNCQALFSLKMLNIKFKMLSAVAMVGSLTLEMISKIEADGIPNFFVSL